MEKVEDGQRGACEREAEERVRAPARERGGTRLGDEERQPSPPAEKEDERGEEKGAKRGVFHAGNYTLWEGRA